MTPTTPKPPTLAERVATGLTVSGEYDLSEADHALVAEVAALEAENARLRHLVASMDDTAESLDR